MSVPLQPGQAIDEGALRFLERQPGGFDRDFFGLQLMPLVEEYREHRGLDYSTMIVTVRLRSGTEFAATAVRTALTWVMFITEDDALRFVPIGRGRRDSRRPSSSASAQAHRPGTSAADDRLYVRAD